MMCIAALFFSGNKALDENDQKRLNMTEIYSNDVINLFAHKIFFMVRGEKKMEKGKRHVDKKFFFFLKRFSLPM